MPSDVDVKKKSSVFYLAFGVCAIFVLIIYSFTTFSAQLKEEELASAQDQLQEIALLGSNSLYAQVNASIETLDAIAASLPCPDKPEDSANLEVLQSLIETTNFHNFGIINADSGFGQTTNGRILRLEQEDLEQDILSGLPTASRILEDSLENEKVFTVAVPVFQDGEITGALYGAYDLARMREQFHMNHLHNKYTHIFSASGEWILFSPEHVIPDRESIWDSLKDCEFDPKFSIEQMQQDIADGESGYILYRSGNQDIYSYYSPLNISDWYVLSNVTQDDASEHIDWLGQISLMLTGKVIIGFLLCALMTGIYISQIWRRLKQNYQEMKIQDETFQIAMSKSHDLVFEYNITERTLEFRNRGAYSSDLPALVSDLPEKLIEDGTVCPGSVPVWRRIFDQLHKGGDVPPQELELQLQPDRRIWTLLSLTNIRGNNRQILRSIGLLENITDQKKNELLQNSEQEYRRILLAKATYGYEVNLTQDQIFQVQNSNKSTESVTLLSKPYSVMTEELLSKKICPEDIEKVREVFDIGNLLHAYKQGVRDLKLVYRCLIDGNRERWLESSVHLLEKPVNGEIKGYILTKDIDAQKKHELSLQYRSEIDALTQLYNRVTTVYLVNQCLQDPQTSGGKHAFLILDLDNFKAVNDTLGHSEGDYVLRDVSAKIRAHFRSTDIVGRLGGDEFIIFLKEIREENYVEELVKGLLEKVDHIYQKDHQAVHISASIGISLAPRDGQDFNDLYEKADQALYQVKNSSKNGVKVYEAPQPETIGQP